MQQKLLSLVMPTYNRAWIIEYTLSLIKDQVKRHADEVELIVCNDCSPDNTTEVVEKILKEDPFFKYVNYPEHANGIGISLSRSLDNGNGKYLMFLGDDDVPAPNMVDVILEKLKLYPEVACVHFNRLQGNPDNGVSLKNLNVFYKTYSCPETLYESSKEFTKNHYRGMCFLSCYVFTKEAWEKGKPLWTKDHFGFEYLVPILYGIQGRRCLYLNYPLCIQRFLTNPQYMDKWPLYIYVGIPRVLRCLQELKCIDDWRECYDNYHSAANNGDFLWHILMIATKHKDIYLPYYDEMQSNVTTAYRHCVLKLLKWPDLLLGIPQYIFPKLPWYIQRIFTPKHKIKSK